MPRAPKICGFHNSDGGCINLVRDAVYCPDHQRPRTASARATGNRRFNQTIRPAVFARDGHACTIRGPGCNGRAQQVDHIVQVSDGGSDELSNLRSCCTPCHRARTARDAAAASSMSEGSATRPGRLYRAPLPKRPVAAPRPPIWT